MFSSKIKFVVILITAFICTTATANAAYSFGKFNQKNSFLNLDFDFAEFLQNLQQTASSKEANKGQAKHQAKRKPRKVARIAKHRTKIRRSKRKVNNLSRWARLQVKRKPKKVAHVVKRKPRKVIHNAKKPTQVAKKPTNVNKSAITPKQVTVNNSDKKLQPITLVDTKIVSSTERVTVVSDPVLTTIKNTDTIKTTDPDTGAITTTNWEIYYDTWITTTTVKDVTTKTEIKTFSDGSTQSKVIEKLEVIISQTDDKKTSVRRNIAGQTVTEPVKPVVAAGTTSYTPTKVTLDYDPATYNADAYYGHNPNMGTPTAVPSHDPAYFRTPESDNRSIQIAKAEYAYARGWTGKGSTIMIMDSGIDTDHPDFAGKIKYQWDPGYSEGIEDVFGHGTHVAGIAAGAKNNFGSHGIAYDANLAIAKITSNGYGYSYATSALRWAADKPDIVVANLSANTIYSNSYRNSIVDRGNGIYTSNDPIYGGANYYNMENPKYWANALPAEMVVTVAAGNMDLPYVQNPATFATATDSNGNLLLNGRMLIVGNWNYTTQTVDGAKAGHICKDYSESTNTCNDKYRTSDFYILAPGTNVKSAYINGATKTMSGTSMAAPAVAGAVAIIHQLWPYMKGKNIVQLLLKTADKNLPNYDVNVHGQGLLDLERATRPVGNLQIALDGRTGPTKPLSGAISGISGGALQTLSSVTAVDDFDRDFTVDISSTAAVGNNQTLKQVKHHKGQSWAGKFVGEQETQIGPMNFTIYNQDTKNFAIGYTMSLNKTTGINFTYAKSDENPWIEFDGMWGKTKDSQTAELSITHAVNKNGYIQAGLMNTHTDFTKGIVQNVDDIVSAYAVAGYKKNGINLFGGIRPTALRGGVDMKLPTSVDKNGNMQYTNVHANIDRSVTGFLGMGYTKESKLHGNKKLTHEWNALVDSKGETEISYNFKMRF